MIGKVIGVALLAAIIAHQMKPAELPQLMERQPPPSEVRYSGTIDSRNPATYEEIAPPERFRGTATVILHYVDAKGLIRRCGDGPVACARGDWRGQAHNTLPNPCNYRHEYFAALACHEKGHSLGWSGEHGA